MSVMKLQAGKLPKDAVILSYDDALAHQLELISKWDKSREVWPLRSGISIIALTASATGIYMNSHYRRKLKLMRFGFMSTYLPIVVLPGMVSAVFHKIIITYDIIMEKNECPLCLQAKAALLQISIGFFYPLILSPLGNFMHATRHATCRLPSLLNDFPGVAKVLVKFARPIGTQLSVICVGQGLMASYFTYLEAKSYYTVKQRMAQIQKEYESGLTNSDNENE